MARDTLPDKAPPRAELLTAALRLVSVSVVFGVLTGAASVAAGLRGHSLGVFGAGLGVLADVTGSAVLVWRFRAEHRRAGHSATLDTRAALVVAVALATVGTVLTAQSAEALAAGSHPGRSPVALILAGVTLVVLTPLAYAKRRLGSRMASHALEGDGALSAIGAATGLLALTGLVLYQALGWWWADRVAALVVAALAALEACRIASLRPSSLANLPWRRDRHG